MWPRAMKAIGSGEKSSDLQQTLDGLLVSNKTTVSGDGDGHNTETARTQRDDVVIAWLAFARHAGMRFGCLPVVAKGCFLDHGEQLVVRHRMGGGRCGRRRRRFEK